MKKTVFFLALTLVLIPIAAHADGPTVLLGLQSVSFGGDLAKDYDVPPGIGFSLVAAFDIGFPLDVRIGQRKTTEGDSGDDLTYQWLEAGPRFALSPEETTIQIDWFAGFGYYDLEIGSTSFDSPIGGYLGLGFEEVISNKFIGRLEMKGVYWKSGTGSTDGPSLNLSLLFGRQF